MELGVHLPLMRFGDEPLSLARLAAAVDAARDRGYAAISANDHFVFRTPWLDGPTALGSMVERSGDMELATTVALAVLRGPVPLAKALTAIDVLSGGRAVAAVGPGSSRRDYDLVGVPFDARWKRFDAALDVLRGLLGPDTPLDPGPRREGGIPLWIGSWGSRAGVARVARAGDGWLASAYNTTPERFAAGRRALAEDFPCALATMWTWVAEDRAAGERVLTDILAPLLERDADDLRGQVCVGPAEHCAELLARYADAGCDRVYVWPLGDEPRQLELLADAAPAYLADA